MLSIRSSPKFCYLVESYNSKISISNDPFPKQQILDPSKLKEFADDNFTFDENGRKFSKWLENTVGKGEIARLKDLFCRRIKARACLGRC